MSEEMVAGANSGVAEAPVQTVVNQVTPVVDGGVAKVTPTEQTPSDAELARLREDLNRQKAASQRREWEQQRAFQAQMEAMNQAVLERERQLFEVQTANLDPQEKKQAHAQWEAQQRESQLQQQLEAMQYQMGQLTAEQQSKERKNQAIQFFAHTQNIPIDELARHADSPDRLVEFVRTRNMELTSKAERQPDPAPAVTRGRPAGASTGLVNQAREMSSTDLRKLIDLVASGRKTVTLDEL